MKKINTLILSAGRRVELVQLFQKSLIEMNISGKVIGADCSNLAPALYFTDTYTLIPKIDDPSYIDSIIKICNEYDIDLVIPTIDTELIPLSKNKKLIESSTHSKLMISDLDMISICRDKIKTNDYLESLGFKVPKLLSYVDAKRELKNNPVFIKPISGSSSINAFKASNVDELDTYIKLINNFMIQEYIGGDEYTVDVFLDYNSNPITIVPRLRIATRAGEISKGKIIKDRIIIDEVKRLLLKTHFIGHITIQLKKLDDKITFIEINPRFGGGAPMSIMAGANSCHNLFKLHLGETLTYSEEYNDNLIFLRYDSAVMIHD